MSFKIVEQKLAGKSPKSKLCEDKIVITDNFACIIDGSTSKSNFKYKGKTQGIMAGNLLEKIILDLDPNTSCENFISTVNSQFSDYYNSIGLYEHMKNNEIDRYNASIALYHNKKKEVWMIGDCQAIINNTHHQNIKKIDTLLSDIRSFYLQWEMINGKNENDLIENDTGRTFIMSLLKKQHKFQNNKLNTEYSYGVIDGFEICKQDIKVIKVDSDEIVLASDGYPKLFKTLEDSELYLKETLLKDPLFFKTSKSTKGLQKGLVSNDDRAFLKLLIKQ